MTITFHPDGRIIDSTGRDIAYKPVYDVWQLTANITGDDDIIAGSQWTRSSTTNTQKSGAHTNVGAAMSVDSTGYWTFPSTGKWEVNFSANWQSSQATRYNEIYIYFTKDNSDYQYIARPAGNVHDGSGSSSAYDTTVVTALLDVIDTSTHKCYFRVNFEQDNNCILKGYSGFMASYVSFKRIADT